MIVMTTFETQDSAGYLANHMARLFAQGLSRRIKPLGIVPGQFPALLALWARDGLTQKELVAQLAIEQATLANTLARMERDGLIRRTRHPTDARAQQIWLTPAARAIEAAACEAARAENREALADLSAPEREQFLDLMRRIIDTMQDPAGAADRSPKSGNR